MKRSLLYGFAATAVCATIAAGCGSGGRTIAVPASTPTPTPVATPTPIGATPSPSPIASSGTGDFAFVQSLSVQNLVDSYYTARALNADGTGTGTLMLQSARGFTSPITFVPSVTVVKDVDGSTLDPSAASVSFSPSSFASLPVGNTPVTLTVAVKPGATLPPLTRIRVRLYAQGGGLKRYLSGDGAPASGFSPSEYDRFFYDFVTAGFAFQINASSGSFSGTAGSTLSASAFIETFGLTGTATFAVTGAPTGLTAAFGTPTLAITPNPAVDSSGSNELPRLSVTFTANQNIPAGTYPVHLTATINGTTYASDALNITVSSVASN